MPIIYILIIINNNNDIGSKLINNKQPFLHENTGMLSLSYSFSDFKKFMSPRSFWEGPQ